LGGFHTGLSVGFGAVSLANNADDSKLAGTTMGGSVFAGWDFVIARSWSFGLALVASGVTSASMKTSSGDDTTYKLGGYSIDLAASLLYF
jgi:hypothetical protein